MQIIKYVKWDSKAESNKILTLIKKAESIGNAISILVANGISSDEALVIAENYKSLYTKD